MSFKPGDIVLVKGGDGVRRKVWLYSNNKSSNPMWVNTVMLTSRGGFILTATLIADYKRHPEVSMLDDIDSAIGKTFQFYNEDVLELAPTIGVPIPATTRVPPHMDGASCVKCGEFIYMANPGVKCYQCRQDPFRMSL